MPGQSQPSATSRRRRAMRPRVLFEALTVWVVLLIVAILNAGVRERVVAPRVGEYAGHVVSTVLTGVPAFLTVAYCYFRWTDLNHTRRERELVGLLWVTLTVAFEFLFGHYVMGNSWARLLHDYDVLAGRVWILVPLALLVAPLAFGGAEAGDDASRRDPPGGPD